MTVEEQLRAHYAQIADDPHAQRRLAQYAAGLAQDSRRHSPGTVWAVIAAAAAVVAIAAISYALAGPSAAPGPMSVPAANASQTHQHGNSPSRLPTSSAGPSPTSRPTAGNIPLTPIPPLPAAKRLPNGACRAGDSTMNIGGPHAPLPTVNTATTGAVVYWLPGANNNPCRSESASIGADPAQDLARRINAAPKFPTGTMSCGSDDGTAIAVYFQVPGAPKTKGQLVVLAPTGCPRIIAQHLYSRVLKGGVLRADLGPVTPAQWRAYLAYGW